MPAIRILVVDDEPELGQLLQRYLARFGYSVRIALCGEDAWTAISESSEPFEIFVIDLSLPGMTGGDLIDRLLRSRPEARILATSGYPLDRPATPNHPGRFAFIQKPFTPAQLAGEVSKLAEGLDRKPGS
jgi:DNA-binding NtrC family response regulator